MDKKIRVYTLAGDLEVDSNVVIEAAHELGLEGVKSASSNIDETVAEKIRVRLRPQGVAEKAAGNADRPPNAELCLVFGGSVPALRPFIDALESGNLSFIVRFNEPGKAPVDIAALKLLEKGAQSEKEGNFGLDASAKVQVNNAAAATEFQSRHPQSFTNPPTPFSSSATNQLAQIDQKTYYWLKKHYNAVRPADDPWALMSEFGYALSSSNRLLFDSLLAGKRLLAFVQANPRVFEVMERTNVSPPVHYVKMLDFTSPERTNIGIPTRGTIHTLKHAFGFVETEDRQSIYFHFSELRNCEPSQLRVGGTVTFTTDKNAYGPCARNVYLD